jgi:hypothetical protein
MIVLEVSLFYLTIDSNNPPLMNLSRLNSAPTLLSKHATDFCSINDVAAVLAWNLHSETQLLNATVQKDFITCSTDGFRLVELWRSLFCSRD